MYAFVVPRISVWSNEITTFTLVVIIWSRATRKLHRFHYTYMYVHMCMYMHTLYIGAYGPHNFTTISFQWINWYVTFSMVFPKTPCRVYGSYARNRLFESVLK